jgi:hypothetical protein
MLTLTIVGDLDERQMLEAIASLVASSVRPAESRPLPVFPEHESLVVNQRQTVRMDVAPRPSCSVFAIRSRWINRSRAVTLSIANARHAWRLIACCHRFPLCTRTCIVQGLIHDSFDYHYSCEESFAFLIFGGESPDPEKAALAVRDALMTRWRSRCRLICLRLRSGRRPASLSVRWIQSNTAESSRPAAACRR